MDVEIAPPGASLVNPNRRAITLERTAMPATIPTVTALYAALIGLLAAALTVRVIISRVKTGIQAGDGGQPPLAQAIRAHANLVEQAPMALLLIAYAEATGSPVGVVHALGALLVVARLANAWGLSRSLGPTKPRQAGAGLTVLVVAVAALLILYRWTAAH
jgi:uncharacterized membrane protein YecN with MAPEG domain